MIYETKTQQQQKSKSIWAWFRLFNNFFTIYSFLFTNFTLFLCEVNSASKTIFSFKEFHNKKIYKSFHENYDDIRFVIEIPNNQ